MFRTLDARDANRDELLPIRGGLKRVEVTERLCISADSGRSGRHAFGWSADQSKNEDRQDKPWWNQAGHESDDDRGQGRAS
jgi:hypothetical protein